MCEVCERAPVSAATATKGDRRGLGYLGAVRRSIAGSTKALSQAALEREWMMVDRIKQQGERPMRVELSQLFGRQETEVLTKLQNVRLPRATRSRILAARENPALKDPLIVTSILDLPKWEEETGDVVEKHVETIVQAGFETGLLRVGVEGVDFTSSAPEVLSTIRQVTQKQRGVQQTLADALARDIQHGLSAGEDLDGLTRRVQARFTDMKTWKARQIAQTSATPGFETGQQLAYRDAGVEWESWMTQRDGVVREAHAEADGQVVRVGEKFEVDGEMLAHPGDPAGSARNVIGCRCSTRPRLNGPAET